MHVLSTIGNPIGLRRSDCCTIQNVDWCRRWLMQALFLGLWLAEGIHPWYKLDKTCLLGVDATYPLGGLLWRPCGLRRRHWLHAVSHLCLGSNPSLGMWESCHQAVVFAGYSGFLHYLQLASHELAVIGINVTKNKIPKHTHSANASNNRLVIMWHQRLANMVYLLHSKHGPSTKRDDAQWNTQNAWSKSWRMFTKSSYSGHDCFDTV